MTTKIKMWSQVPLGELKKKYFSIHNLIFLQKIGEIPAEDFVVSIDGEGYWLSGIISANIDKRYEVIKGALFNDGDEKSKLMWTELNGKLLPILKVNKSIKEVIKKINLPE
ncbi:MAG: hypothetical protein WC548_01160 [Candidatus Pacearchaeota archaeon]